VDYLDFVRSLSAEQRKSLTQKSNWPGGILLALHSAALLTTGALIIGRVSLWPVVLVVHGILLMFLFTLMHEATHKTAFASRSTNEAVAIICGLILAIPAQWFKYFHFAHHRHTQDPEKDPELATAKPTTRWQYVQYLSGVPLWYAQFSTLIKNARGRCCDEFVPHSRHVTVTKEARWMLVLYALVLITSLYFKFTHLVYIWILPAFLGQPFLRLFLLAEHGHCAQVKDVFSNTRTTWTNVLTRTIAWNMPYHAEHHAYPSVPFFRLPELHKLMKSHLVETERGYIRFNKCYLRDVGRCDRGRSQSQKK